MPEIRDGNAAHLRVILGRNDDLQRGGQRAVAPDEFGAVFVESSLVGVRFDAGRLVAGRPDFAGLHVAQKYIAAPAIARGILAPSGHGDIPPAAIA